MNLGINVNLENKLFSFVRVFNYAFILWYDYITVMFQKYLKIELKNNNKMRITKYENNNIRIYWKIYTIKTVVHVLENTLKTIYF